MNMSRNTNISPITASQKLASSCFGAMTTVVISMFQAIIIILQRLIMIFANIRSKLGTMDISISDIYAYLC